GPSGPRARTARRPPPRRLDPVRPRPAPSNLAPIAAAPIAHDGAAGSAGPARRAEVAALPILRDEPDGGLGNLAVGAIADADCRQERCRAWRPESQARRLPIERAGRPEMLPIH